MSFNTFKSLDLLIFSLVAVIFEVINKFAAVSFSSFKLIFMSFTIVLALISMYRWGVSGIIVAVFAKLIAVVISDHRGNYVVYLSYIIGTLLGIVSGFIIFQKIIGKKRIKKQYLMITYLIFDFAFSILFMSIIFALCYSSSFGEVFVSRLKTSLIEESMSIFTSCIILVIANRKNGNILVEMRTYVKTVQESKKLGGLKEIKDSPKFNSDNPYTEFDQLDEGNILDGGTMDVDQLKDLEKMYNECDKIHVDDPIDCLAKQEKKDK